MIEALVWISVSSILLTIVALWLHKLLLFSNTLGERQRDHINLNHLATDLRQDSMFAKSWSFPNPQEPDRLELVMANDSRVQYRLVHEDHGSKIHAVHLAATVAQADNGKENQAQPVAEADNGKQGQSQQPSATTQHETYRFSPGCRLKWERGEFPRSLVLIAYRVPTLANPLPKKSVSDSKIAPDLDSSRKNFNDSASEQSSGAIESSIQLTPNRWAGRILRAVEDSQ